MRVTSVGRSGAFVVGALLVPLVLLSAVLVGVMLGMFGSDSSCNHDLAVTTPVGVRALTSSQLANASAVIETGTRMDVPTRGIVIALATANQESHFTNFANDGRGGDLVSNQRGIGASLQLPHEAVGSDHGSLGVFQQQWPWWGSMAELMDPGTAAQKFYRALLSIPGWESQPLTVAAQAVQGSAFPDAYADDEALARQLLGASAVTATSTSTGVSSGGCDVSSVDPDMVLFPLPAGSSYRDNHNFGHVGGQWASVHTGDDYSVACGTPVLAATAGRVLIRADQPWAGPQLVQVSTGTGQLTTWYAHMRRVIVTDGQPVTAGQQIGEVGDRGNATGCHLHFEVHPQGGSIYQDDVTPSRGFRSM